MEGSPYMKTETQEEKLVWKTFRKEMHNALTQCFDVSFFIM